MTHRALAQLLLLALLSAGCPGPLPPPVVTPPQMRAVAVVVTSQTGPVAGAVVTLDDAAPHVGTTDAAGYVLFTPVPAALTESHLTIVAAGFVGYSQHADVPGGNATLAVTLTAAEPPPVPRPVVRWPALCASFYAAATHPDMDADVFARWLHSVGATCTRTWLLDAWAVGGRDAAGRFLPGQYDGYLPIVRLADGRYDLDQWNARYFTHLRAFADTMNRQGVWPHFTILDLYTWSDRKAGLPFVPDPARGPFRHNVNGVRWGHPDDDTFLALPDAWMKRFMCRVVSTLDGASYAIELGNEMPEKEMHDRLRDALRACGYRGEITVNRNEDTPGQFFNMGIAGRRFDRLALHGMLDLSYLDVEYPEEVAAGRPTTFRAMWPLVDPARIILSSDGGGGNPVHLDHLRAVACDALRRGASYEHQLALKRRMFFGDGSLNLADLAIDEAMLRSLAECR